MTPDADRRASGDGGRRDEIAAQESSSVAGVLQTGDIAALIEALKALLAAGPLRPERILAQDLAVSRHRLRRALDALRTAGDLGESARAKRALSGGLVFAKSHEAIVRDTNPLEVIELRLAIEPSLVRLAALRASPLDILRIQKAASPPSAADSGKADLAFHRLIAEASRNTLAANLYALLRQVGADARLHMGAQSRRGAARIAARDAAHRAISDAIARRDPDAAEAAMRGHLAAVSREISERMSPQTLAAV